MTVRVFLMIQGLNPVNNGFDYLVRAIEFYRSTKKPVSSGSYICRKISKDVGMSARAIENSMRYAIKKAYINNAAAMIRLMEKERYDFHTLAPLPLVPKFIEAAVELYEEQEGKKCLTV